MSQISEMNFSLFPPFPFAGRGVRGGVCRRRARCWKLSLCGCLLAAGNAVFFPTGTPAQIAPDATEPVNSAVTANGTAITITGGTVKGSNLFHSFERFSLPTGSTAHFNNAPDIQNILTRVTGRSMSHIDGTIQANGSANFFLLNPNGIIFGPNASLNIGGSFIASTAASLNFADGSVFSAATPQNPPLLTVSVPVGLQYGPNPGRILVLGGGEGIRTTADLIDTSAGLRVAPAQTLALVGSEVALYGGTLKTAGGRIELGSVAGAGTVSLTPAENGFSLGYEGVPAFGDIQLSGGASADASGAGGGDVRVTGRRVTLTGGSQIETSTLDSEPGGTLEVRASELVELAGESAGGERSSRLLARVYEGATGTGSNITVETRALIARNGSQVRTSTESSGRGGSVSVVASDSVELTGTSANNRRASGVRTPVEEGATGTGGNITLQTRRLIVQNGAQVSAAPFGAGQGGNLTVSASESVELIGRAPGGGSASNLSTAAQQEATGAGGNLTVRTQRLTVRNGAQLSAGTFGAGRGGNLEVSASESVELLGTGTSPSGERPSGLFTQANRQATGAAGSNLTVTTRRLAVRDGAHISASTSGPGPAGNLTVRASESVDVAGSAPNGAFPSRLTAQTSGGGSAGTLSVETPALTVRDGAEISARSRGAESGAAGSLQVQAGSVRLDSGGAITATTESGDGGNIRLRAQELLLLRGNSNISTTAGTAGAGGNGGNIRIESGNLVALEDSDITANAYTGNGGNIQISTTGFFLSAGSNITASSRYGLAGTVEISTPDAGPGAGLIALPEEVVDIAGLIDRNFCAVGSSSRFTVTGAGGLPPSPSDALSSNAVWEDWRAAAAGEVVRRGAAGGAESPVRQKIVEAQGWEIGAGGEVILTAVSPGVSPHSPWRVPASCPLR